MKQLTITAMLIFSFFIFASCSDDDDDKKDDKNDQTPVSDKDVTDEEPVKDEDVTPDEGVKDELLSDEDSSETEDYIVDPEGMNEEEKKIAYVDMYSKVMCDRLYECGDEQMTSFYEDAEDCREHMNENPLPMVRCTEFDFENTQTCITCLADSTCEAYLSNDNCPVCQDNCTGAE